MIIWMSVSVLRLGRCPTGTGTSAFEFVPRSPRLVIRYAVAEQLIQYNINRTTYHPHGTCAMGKVVDTEFRVKGVKGLRVVDASVYPVPITGHLQAVTYAMAQQAADIIGVVGTNGSSARRTHWS